MFALYLKTFQKLLSLGDYVGRGKQQVDVFIMLLLLKLRWPRHIYMLRGTHECAERNIADTFFAAVSLEQQSVLFPSLLYNYDCFICEIKKKRKKNYTFETSFKMLTRKVSFLFFPSDDVLARPPTADEYYKEILKV